MPGFLIPNTPDATYGDQSEPDAVDFEIISDLRFGTFTGGDVAQQASPNMTVQVSAWLGMVDGSILSITGGNVTIDAASANARFDLIIATSAGAFGIIKGTPSATNPVMPVWPKTSAVLAAIYIPAGTTAIVDGMIVPKHVRLSPVLKERSAASTDTVLDLGTTAGGSLFRVDSAGKLTWEAGATDLVLEKLDANGLNLVGSIIAQAVNTAVATATLKAKAAQTAALLRFLNSAGSEIGYIGVDARLKVPNFNNGAASPEGAVTGNVGDIYFQTGGTMGTDESRVWIKSTGSGNTGWTTLALYNPTGGIATGIEVSWPCNGSLPAGFLECNGQSVSRATYAGLFAVIGTTFGAVDGSTFNVPDRQRRTLMGRDTGVLAFDSVADTGGALTVTLLTANLPSHTHTVTESGYTHSHAGSSVGGDSSHTHSVTDPGHTHAVNLNDANGASGTTRDVVRDASFDDPDVANTYEEVTGISIPSSGSHSHTLTLNGDTHSHSVSLGNTGSGTAVDITPRYGVTRWMIKT